MKTVLMTKERYYVVAWFWWWRSHQGTNSFILFPK